jgi:drug/metabolite transporter (DMT)-like permease
LNQRTTHWAIFILLSLTWGSSFILMKIGMLGLSPYQVASLRLFSAGLTLLPFFVKAIRQIPRNKIPVIILCGILGNLIPAYLFCIAETRVDSALAGMLNALVPLMALLAAFFIFKVPIVKNQLLGIFIGLLGVILLFAAQGISTGYWYYGLWIVLATVCYGLNISLIHNYLKGFSSVQLSAVSLFFCAMFSLPVLIFTGFFSMLAGPAVPWTSIAAAATLGIMGSGIATVLFYVLINKAGAMFASMVTYVLPVVAIGWGLLYDEHISLFQVGCMVIILIGVYLVNRKKA